MRHHLQLSNVESRVRMQIVRLYDTLPAWEHAARNGDLGLEQIRLAARTFARTTIRQAFIDQSDELLDDAINKPSPASNGCCRTCANSPTPSPPAATPNDGTSHAG